MGTCLVVENSTYTLTKTVTTTKLRLCINSTGPQENWWWRHYTRW